MTARSQRASREPDPAQHLTFFVGATEYAVDILKVREVLELDTVTRVPLAPACIRGVMNVRGSVVPVIDLATKFGSRPEPTTMKTCVVVVELTPPEGKIVLGFVADAVHRVTEFGAGDLVAPPPFGTPIHIDYLQAMGKVGQGFVLILDIDKVLSTEELLAASGLDQRAATPLGSAP